MPRDRASAPVLIAESRRQGLGRPCVAQILRRSKGNPANVTPRERQELRRLAGKLDLRRLGQDLAPRVLGRRKR